MGKLIEPILGLSIDIPARGSRQRLRALHDHLRTAILEGRLAPGIPLPPTRHLAATLGVGRNTVVAAYDLLVSEGYATTRCGAGTFVASELSTLRPRKTRPPGKSSDPRLNVFWRRAATSRLAAPSPPQRYDFRPGLPDTSHFPFAIWRHLAARALRRFSRQPSAYGPAQGQPALREAVAMHISYTRAVACQAEDIVITAGAQQAFDLLARILVKPARTVVAVEEPGYAPLRNAFKAAGARVVPVPVDREGLVVAQLPIRAHIICVTPSHQFPLGCTMSLARRVALLDFARRQGAVIIEDDYDGEFRFGGRPLDALRSLDQREIVFYVGTFSKSLFPALRIGYAVIPHWARGALLAARKLCDWHGDLLAQDTLAAFINEGHLTRHVRKMRRVYLQRRDILRDALCRDWDGQFAAIPADAGLHLTALERAPRAVDALLERARQTRIGLYPLRDFYCGRPDKQGLVFGFAALDAHAISAALACLHSARNK